jgi:hypothetical protein
MCAEEAYDIIKNIRGRQFILYGRINSRINGAVQVAKDLFLYSSDKT